MVPVGCKLLIRRLARQDRSPYVRQTGSAVAERVRTVAIPVWVKKGMDAWQEAGSVEKGPLLRSVGKGGKVGESLSDWAIWSVVTEAAKEIGIDRFGAHDSGGLARSFAARPAVTWSRSSSCLGIRRSRPRSATWGRSRTSP